MNKKFYISIIVATIIGGAIGALITPVDSDSMYEMMLGAYIPPFIIILLYGSSEVYGTKNSYPHPMIAFFLSLLAASLFSILGIMSALITGIIRDALLK